MKRIKSILLAIAIAMTAPMLLSSCQEDAPEINYTMNVSVTNDFSEVVEAINNGNLKSEAAIQELAKAIDKLSGDQQTKLQAILDVLTSLNATLETKLALIEAAMKAQTLSLEGKLSLLETAIKNQTIKQEEMAGKLADAIDNLAGDLDTKLGAIETAITDQTTSLETKLALIEAAMKAQTLSLEGKLDLLETAIKNQTIKQEELSGKLADAIDNLAGDLDAKLGAIETAITDQTTSLETKLALIEAAMKAQTLSLEGKLSLLETAIGNLPDYSSQLEAIETAIAGLPDYSAKLDALKNAIDALPDYSSKFDAVVAALAGIKTEIEALGAGQTDIATQIGNAVTAINSLVSEVSSGNTDAAAALAAIIQKLGDLKTAIENIETGGGSGSGSGSGETGGGSGSGETGGGSGSGSGDSPEGALSGKFSVSSTKQVQFSKGNLQATYDGSKYTWGFAANQYDYIGNAVGNTTINSQTSGAVVDLFGWSTSATYFGINTSYSSGDYSGGFVDWGKNIGDGSTWRTLSKDEWTYLFNTRTNASGLYKASVSVCGKTNCVIIAPDGYTGTIGSSYDASTWPAAEAAGLVCLPAAGFRDVSFVDNVGGIGYYWSSSASGSSLAYDVYFDSSLVNPGLYDTRDYRNYGSSVRLITDVK